MGGERGPDIDCSPPTWPGYEASVDYNAIVALVNEEDTKFTNCPKWQRPIVHYSCSKNAHLYSVSSHSYILRTVVFSDIIV